MRMEVVRGSGVERLRRDVHHQRFIIGEEVQPRRKDDDTRNMPSTET